MQRSRVKIIVDILETVKEENLCPKTRIIQLANLDWDMASRYIKCLVNEGFLETVKKESSSGNKEYKITEKGNTLLKSLQKVRNACSVF